MYSAASEQETSSWLVKDSLKELELLLRAVLSHQSEPILIADDERPLPGRQLRRRQAARNFDGQDDR